MKETIFLLKIYEVKLESVDNPFALEACLVTLKYVDFEIVNETGGGIR